MKTQIITIGAQCAGPEESNGVNLCHNLRRSPSGATLEPVGVPRLVAAGGWRPLLNHTVGEHSYMIMYSGSALAVTDLRASAPVVTEIGSVSGDILTAQTVSAGLIIVMSKSGPYELRLADGAWTLQSPVRCLPVISLTAVDGADVEVEVGERTLSKTYQTTDYTLAERDERAVASDVREAYTELCRRAASAGYYCQPVIARYRLVGAQGETVYESAPLLLGASQGTSATDYITIDSADGRTLGRWTLSARQWRPRLRVVEGIERLVALGVSHIELLVSPQIHPYDPSATVPVECVRGAATGSHFLRVALPGRSQGLVAMAGGGAVARLRELIGRVGALCRTAVSMAVTDDITVLDCTMPAVTTAEAADEVRDIKRILKSSVKPADRVALSLMLPHGFTAREAAEASGTVLWGGLCAIRYHGDDVRTFAASNTADTDGAWHAAVSVTFGSGDEQTVATADGIGAAPLTLNPVLSYPSADAVAMKIIISRGGTVMTGTFDLTPDASGRRAVFVHPSLRPFALSDEAEAYVVPAERRAEHVYDNAVAIAPVEQSLNIRAVAVTGVSSAVTALAAVRQSQSAWDFGRLRFMIFTSGGMFRVIVSADMTAISVALHDSRPVTDRAAVCDASGRLLALSGRNLLEVGASGCRVLADNIDGERIYWEPARGELTACGDTESSETVCLRDGMRRFSRMLQLVGRGVTGCDGRTYAATAGQTLVCLSDETMPASRAVSWRRSVACGESRLPLSLAFDAAGTSVRLNVTLARRSTDERRSSPVVRAVIDGALRAPMAVRLAQRPIRLCEAGFGGEVSGDFRFAGFRMVTDYGKY